jgi:hypothetical protein
MANVVLNITAQVAFSVPAATTVASTLWSLTPATGTPLTQTSAPDVLTMTFSGVADGAYTGSAQAVDQNGQPVGPAATTAPGEIVIATTHTVNIPGTLTFTLQ